MLFHWTGQSLQSLPFIFLSGFVIYLVILLLTRLTGLRSFSKMSAADFAMTVAVGSLFGAIISQPSPNLIDGSIALAFLFLAQYVIALLRSRLSFFSELIDNQPSLLFEKGEFIEANLTKCNVTKSDIYAKLREANALDFKKVHAVVFETTGDISVLHGDVEGGVDPRLLKDVIS
jgi:uncharacterized membrane protein YcaP (DUF421 family)